MLLCSHFISDCEDHDFFMLIHLTGVLCPFAQVLFHLIKSCISFLPEAFNFVHRRCFLSFKFFNFSRFFGFTRLSEKQLSFTSSLSLLFPLRCHSRSRDEILSQWWSVVTPQVRSFRCLPGFPGFVVCFVWFVASCALHHVIMPSSHKSFATQLNKPYGSSIHLNRGNSHGEFSL